MYWPAAAAKAASVFVSRCNWTALRQRADFLRLQQNGQKWVTPAFVVQAIRTDSPEIPRIGLTVTKKIGHAVIRNRVRRRLRGLADCLTDKMPLTGWEIVLIARHDALTKEFDALCRDAAWAMRRLIEPKEAKVAAISGSDDKAIEAA